MAKKIKVALLFCLTLCVAAFAFVFAACGGGEEDSGYDGTQYTVTVVDADNNPVTNVTVQLCVIEEDGSVGMCLIPVPVNDNGIAVIGGPFIYNGAEQNNVVDDSLTYEIHLFDANNPLDFTGYNTEVRTSSGTYSYTVTYIETAE